MHTPYGQDCRYYYQDFYRGRSTQECRLLARSEGWRPDLCKTCPVPGILQANACPNMILEGHVTKRCFGWLKRVTVYAVCTLRAVEVAEPHVGCGECHKHRPGGVIFGGET
ncbi:MAG: hypothetical protein JW850_08655 [Thermoflexales bacterium]|nr:hypothetical protein [Thermoflexales bacterium]